MAPIRLHDTRPGELRELVPRADGRVGIYVCGPTVYDRIHVGNARPFVVFSLLKRFLQHDGLDVTLDVYFRVRSDPEYGTLSRRAVDECNQGEESHPPTHAQRKEDPLDF